MSVVLGLDVGNSTCAVSVYRQGGLDLVPNEQGSRSTPSCVAFTDAETLLGEPARAQAVRNAANTIGDMLRLLGKAYDDEAFQADLAGWKFRVSKAKDGGAAVDVTLKGEAKSYAAPRLLALLLGQLRADAEAFTGETVKEVVVACPAHFSDASRAALRESAQIGGMRVRQVLSHPLAVAMLYGHTNASGAPTTDAAAGGAGTAPTDGPPTPAPQQLLVVDVGGSSSTASVVERTQTAEAEGESAGEGEESSARKWTDAYAVRASLHELGVGGRAVDAKLQQHVAKEVRRRQRVDLSTNPRAMSRLLAACEGAKHSLSVSSQATVASELDGQDFFSTVTRATLDDLAAAVANQAAELASRALAAAGTPPEHVHAILLAGGTCRMPRVQAAISAVCPNAPLCFGSFAEEVVARGAALSGSLLKPVPLSDNPGERIASLQSLSRLPRALGLATADGVTELAACRAALPLSRTARFAPPVDGSPLLLKLVELEIAGGGAAQPGATAASLAVRDVPEEAEALAVSLRVNTSGGIELSCAAELSGGATAVLGAVSA